MLEDKNKIFLVCEFCNANCEIHFDKEEEYEPSFCPFCGEEMEDDCFVEITADMEEDLEDLDDEDFEDNNEEE